MSVDNGRLSSAFLAALLCLAYPSASNGQSSDLAEGAGNSGLAGAADSRPEATSREAPDEAQPAMLVHKSEDLKAEEEKRDGSPAPAAQAAETPVKAQVEQSITGTTDTQPSENKPVEAKSAEQKPAESKAAAEKPAAKPTPVVAPAPSPSQPPAPVPASAPVEPPAPAPIEKPALTPVATSAPPPVAPTAPVPVVAPVVESEEPKDATLTVASWGGGYGQAQDRAILRPFAAETGRKVEVVSHGGAALKDLDNLRKQDASGKTAWDVINLSGGLASKACEEGLLRPLDLAAVFGEAGAEAARNDFIPGGIQPCAIGSTVWSTVILYNKSAYPKGAPATAQDLFDLARFPGKRALPRGGKYVLELALIADGVEPGKVYETLASEEGLTRALAKLGQIKTSITWWDQGRDSLKLLAGGKASMAMAFSGQAFTGAASRRDALGFIWDGQIYHFDLWAIPKNSRHPRTAREFINFASAPERLVAQTKWFPYGPARLSALAKVGKHAELDIDMAPYLPTSRDNFKNALAFDDQWWVAHGDAVNARMDSWLLPTAMDAAAAAAGHTSAESNQEEEKPRIHRSRRHSRSRDQERAVDKSKDKETKRKETRGRDASNASRDATPTPTPSEQDAAPAAAPDNQEADPNRGSATRWRYPRDFMD
jgi:putative spermidine/putrescine transport system substrate-binding protein